MDNLLKVYKHKKLDLEDVMERIEELCVEAGFDYESFMYLVSYFNMSEPVVIAVLNSIVNNKNNTRSR